MERRDFLKIAFGMAAGAVVTVRAAQAMTPTPSPLAREPSVPDTEAKPALTTSEDVEKAKVEKVRWRHHRGYHRHWHRHHWRRHHWHRRHWGWRRRHWRHRHWRRRHYYY